MNSQEINWITEIHTAGKWCKWDLTKPFYYGKLQTCIKADE